MIYRYIGKKYIIFLGFALLFFVSIYIIVDFAEHISKFIRDNKSFMDIFNYYKDQIPLIINIMFPVSGMLGAFFTYGRMNQFKEILILQTSGLKNIRILMPLIWVSLFFLGMFFLFNNYIATSATIPYRQMYYGLSKDAGRMRAKDNFAYTGSNGIVYYISYLNPLKRIAQRGVIILDPEKMNNIVVFSSALYDSVMHEWIVYDGYIIQNEKVKTFVNKRIKEAKDAPIDMYQDRIALQSMKLGELLKRWRKIKMSGMNTAKIEAEIVDRLLYPLMFLFLSIGGGILAIFSKESGMARGFGLCVILAFFYWGANQMGKAIAQTGTNAWISVSLSHIIIGGMIIWALIVLDK